MQTTDQVLMIRPARFISNPQTAASNAFQHQQENACQAQASALQEFDAYVDALLGAGVGVTVIEDTPLPHTPDSIFPNNWISCHADGRVFVYPMEAVNRRQERRAAVLDKIAQSFNIREVIDLGHFEIGALYLEGTGSMVLDHEHQLAYICHSSRSHPAVMQEFMRYTGYRAIWFHAHDKHGLAIYHTNVMMCIGKGLAVICAEAISDTTERDVVCATLTASGKQIITISQNQMAAFAGNMLELKSSDGKAVFVMSRQAWVALTAHQQEIISAGASVVLAPIENIERLGGGSARCMLAEIFLPRRAASVCLAE